MSDGVGLIKGAQRSEEISAVCMVAQPISMCWCAAGPASSCHLR